MWEQVETSKVISFRYKFVSRFNMKYIFFLVDMKYMLEKSWKCPINPQIRKSTQKAKTYFRRLTKLHMLYYYQKKKEEKKSTCWGDPLQFTVPTDDTDEVEVRKVWSFSYV